MPTTYPMTLGSIRKAVRRRLLTTPTAKDQWDDPWLTDYINRAQVEVQNELLLAFESKYFIKTDDTLTVTGTTIALPVDFIRELTFDKKTGGGQWERVTIVDPARAYEYRYWTPLRTSGELMPTRETWSVINDVLEYQGEGVQPADGIYRLRWQYRVPDLESDDDESEIPAQYHQILVDNAAMNSATDSGESKRASKLESDYASGLNQMKRTAAIVMLTQRRKIRNTYNGLRRL